MSTRAALTAKVRSMRLLGAGRVEMARRHWVEKVRAAFDECRPLYLSPGDAASLWRALYAAEIDTPARADAQVADYMMGRMIPGEEDSEPNVELTCRQRREGESDER